jgi:hypothetical protein
MSELEHARAMLDMAAKDLSALKGMSDPATFAEEVFGFHVQQAVEKCLKAWIAALGGDYPLTHNLATLLAALESRGADVSPFWRLVDYSPFGVAFRYEALDVGDGVLDRPAAIAGVQALFDQVQAILADATQKGV